MALINKEKIKKLKNKTNEWFNRSIDQHVTLAVTGLSRSGKTAFITSLVNQLINEGNGAQLSFFNPVHQGRFIGAKRVPQKHFNVARFDFDQAMTAFCAEPATWPEPTHGISELRLAIRYQPEASLLKYATDMATLYLDITDYPGEWLLDLPMMNLSFKDWSAQTCELLSQSPRQAAAADFIEKLKQVDPLQKADEDFLAILSLEYTQLLHHFRYELGLSVIQPGRFILPGELAGAPVLQFIPFPGLELLDNELYQKAGDDTLLGMLKARYQAYKQDVVAKFYKQHFVNFDRQIVLADCLTPLNNGRESFADLQQAIALIMQSYQYGRSGLLSRLFSPKIDRLLFAATKADHVTPEQHPHLVALLNQLIHGTRQELNFEAIDIKTLAIAAVKTTKAGKSLHQGEEVPVIQGRRLSDNQTITVFPGTVPAKLPKAQYWQQMAFNFIAFAPGELHGAGESLPHVRMDQVLEFLLGDKMA
ncbi:YcjX family protein [Thalassomonas actiniarum]|uniref:YcjX family protein n=1 Tax=Thalassomonas actiniarum TaxID=485447 RepID=UPI000ACBC90B|nr:YcjX family protein [Thalassomonas actiniarum]